MDTVHLDAAGIALKYLGRCSMGSHRHTGQEACEVKYQVYNTTVALFLPGQAMYT